MTRRSLCQSTADAVCHLAILRRQRLADVALLDGSRELVLVDDAHLAVRWADDVDEDVDVEEGLIETFTSSF